ncbi:hypothetical protein [Streptosporangium carneum]|uniref:Uncharacterized protein n=1 Tax=Streptosporangium carneum TaxID=47481 RepID=A0A9W6MBK6_9ACTN|nr:hypothetical protein [Streptosporangium carneum]GLK08216.1 hypothetical protein GCM10017600_16210 [Streptosporangium carneum]
MAAWRIKRNARQAAIRSGGAGADPVAEGWAALGVHGGDTIGELHRAISALLDDSAPPAEDLETIRGSLEGAPDPSLPTAVRSALVTVPPRLLIKNLGELLQAGMPWITDVGRRKVQLLSFDHPLAGVVRLPGDDVLEGGAKWRLYLAALGHPARVTTAEVTRIIPDLPLTVVDDFIDLGLLGEREQPWRLRPDPDESLYLRARLTPDSIERQDATTLGWAEIERRHAFLEGDELLDGADLFSLLAAFWRGETDITLRTRLSSGGRALYDEITVGAQTGRWPQRIVTDRGLWPLLTAHWTPSESVNPKLSEFHAWRALYNCYRWILMGWFDRAKPQVEGLLEASNETDGKRERLLPDAMRAEIHTMAAYLAQENNELEFAIKLLEMAQDTHPEVRENLRRLRERRALTMNNRDHWENPYLMLGVPHGDPGWEDQWRDLRKELNHDVDRLTHINAAKRRLMHAERHGADFYVLPLEESSLHLSRERSAALLPPVEPLHRRTSQSKPEDFDPLRVNATRSLLDDFEFSMPKNTEPSDEA